MWARGRIFYMGLCFFILFTSFGSFQNLITQIYQQENFPQMGLLSILIIYGVYATFTIFTPYIVKKLGYKFSCVFSSFTYVCILLGGIYSTVEKPQKVNKYILYALVIFTSILCGLGAGIIWIAQGGYVGDLIQQHKNKHRQDIKGQLNGLFWTMMMLSQISGNTLNTFILKNLSHQIYFFILISLSFIGFTMFFFLKNYEIEQSGQQDNPLQNLKIIISNFKKPYAINRIYIYTLGGCIVGFYTGYVYMLVQLSIDTSQQKQVNFKTGLVFIVLGVSQVTTGILMNQFSDKFNSYILCIFFQLVIISTFWIQVALCVSLITYFIKQYWLCFIVTMLWGSLQTFFMVVTGVILRIQFKNIKEGTALFRMVYSYGTFFTVLINWIIKKNNGPLWLLPTIFLVLGFISIYLSFYVKNPNKNQIILINQQNEKYIK